MDDGVTIDPNRFKYLDLFEQRIKQTIYRPVIEVDFDMPEQNIYTQMYDLHEDTIKEIRRCNRDYRKRKYDNYMLYLSDLRNTIAQDLSHRRMLAKMLIRHDDWVQPLIYYSLNSELEAIEYTLNKMDIPYSLVNGDNPFRNVDVSNLNQAIVIQYGSGGTGVEFPKSNLSIFYGLTYSWIDTRQSFGRNVRRNEKHKVNQIFLLSTNMHDEKVFDKLTNKSEFEKSYLEDLADVLSKEGDD